MLSQARFFCFQRGKVPSRTVEGVLFSVVNRPFRPRPLRTACPPSSTVTGRHRAATINTYTVTVERAVQDINRFIYISRLSISSKNSGSDRADVEGFCFSQDSGEMYLL